MNSKIDSLTFEDLTEVISLAVFRLNEIGGLPGSFILSCMKRYIELVPATDQYYSACEYYLQVLA